MQSVHKAAAVFAPLTDGANTDEVAAFLTSVGSIGAGLHELLQTEQTVGGIFRKCSAQQLVKLLAGSLPEMM